MDGSGGRRENRTGFMDATAHYVAAFNFAPPITDMPEIPPQVVWRRLRKHTAINAQKFDASVARKTSKDGGPALYNPNAYHTDEQIRSLEERCIREGVVVSENAVEGQAICYLQVDTHGPWVGACSGDFTHYVWVEMYANTIHGYPISEDLLRERLRKRGLQGP